MWCSSFSHKQKKVPNTKCQTLKASLRLLTMSAAKLMYASAVKHKNGLTLQQTMYTFPLSVLLKYLQILHTDVLVSAACGHFSSMKQVQVRHTSIGNPLLSFSFAIYFSAFTSCPSSFVGTFFVLRLLSVPKTK